jgi:predicted Zn-dependent protease
MLALAGVLLNAQEPSQSDVNFSSKAKEAALGAALAGEVQRHTSVIADSTVHDYIESLGRRLAVHVRSGDLDWKFAVIRDDVGGSTHEALAVPGGNIFVSASLILAAENEAELASMVAHSMAHLAERHGMRMVAAGQTANPAGIPLVYLGGWMGTGVAGNDDRALIPAGYLRTYRSNELDADRVAVEIMAAAGYAPAALLDYVRRTQGTVPGEAGRYSALPSREERISALETAVANLPSRTNPPGGEFKAIQDRVRELALPLPYPLKEPPALRRKGEQ